jgi:hypothetical protein
VRHVFGADSISGRSPVPVLQLLPSSTCCSESSTCMCVCVNGCCCEACSSLGCEEHKAHPAKKVARQVDGMVGRRAAMCCALIVPCGETTSLAVGVGTPSPSKGLPRILLAACSTHDGVPDKGGGRQPAGCCTGCRKDKAPLALGSCNGQCLAGVLFQSKRVNGSLLLA